MLKVTASPGGPAGDANQEIVGALVIVIHREIGNFFEIFGIEFKRYIRTSSDV
jgi:hypothetical protein